MHKECLFSSHKIGAEATDKGTVVHVSLLSAVNIRINFTSPETRLIVLSDTENCTIISSFVCRKHRNVTDERTEFL